MLLGIAIMLVASAAYNSAPILLRLVTRTLPERTGPALVHAVLTRTPGRAGLALSIVGWSLEIAALTRLPLTLARSLFAAGLGLVLILSHWALGEPVGRSEILGAGAVVAGMVAVGIAAPARSTTPPDLAQGLVLLALLGPVVLAPYALRLAGRQVGAITSAVGAGAAYALAALFNKGLSNLLLHLQVLPLVLVLAGSGTCALLGFMGELDALRHGRPSVVTPVYRALQTVVPIVCAPAFFGERWPSDIGARVLLAGGILLTLIGIMVVSRHHIEMRGYTRSAARPRLPQHE